MGNFKGNFQDATISEVIIKDQIGIQVGEKLFRLHFSGVKNEIGFQLYRYATDKILCSFGKRSLKGQKKKVVSWSWRRLG